MSVKFRKFLVAERERARLENRLFDWVWLKSCWRPVKFYRTVKRGAKKGQIEVELYDPPGRKKIVRKNCMRYKEVDYAELAYEARKRK